MADYTGGVEVVAVMVAGEQGVESIGVVIGQSCGCGETGSCADDEGFGFVEGDFEYINLLAKMVSE